MRNLTLNVKKEWFDMILSGVKKEEYREIKQLYENKFIDQRLQNILDCTTQNEIAWIEFDTVTFLNGMKKLTPTIVLEWKGIEIKGAVPEWSDNWKGDVFAIKLGKLISTKNINNNAPTYL